MDNQELISRINNQILELQNAKNKLEQNTLTNAEKAFISDIKTSKTRINVKNLTQAEKEFINSLKN